LYLSYNRYDEALFEYNKVIALDSENLEAKVKIAKVYAKKGFIAKAIEELRALKNEEPAYAPARIALGVLHYGNGNILEAQTEWEKVLLKDPFHSEASMYLNLSKTATETNLRTV
jgi:tetratricopeptide (TPR) repeat protein